MVASFLEGLGRGFRSMTLVSILAIALVAAAVSGPLLFGSPRIVVAVLGTVQGPRYAWDNWFVNMRVVRIAEIAEDAPLAMLVGNSSMREALRSETYMEKALRARGAPMEVMDLSSAGQPVWYSALIAERAACGRSGSVLLLGVNVSQLAWDPDLHSRERYVPPLEAVTFDRTSLAARAAFIDSLLTEWLYMEQLLVLLKVKRSDWRRGFVMYDPDAGRHRVIDPVWELEINRKQIERQGGQVLAGHEANEDAYHRHLDALLRRLAACGASQVILIETPLHPMVFHIDGLPPVIDRFRKRIRETAARHGAPVIDLSKEIPALETAIFDFNHVRSEDGQNAATDAMVHAIVAARETTP